MYGLNSCLAFYELCLAVEDSILAVVVSAVQHLKKPGTDNKCSLTSSKQFLDSFQFTRAGTHDWNNNGNALFIKVCTLGGNEALVRVNYIKTKFLT